MAELSGGKKAKRSVLSIRHTAVLSLSSERSPVLPSEALNTSRGSTWCVCVCVYSAKYKREHRYIIIID